MSRLRNNTAAPPPRQPIPITRAEVLEWARVAHSEAVRIDDGRASRRLLEGLLNIQHSLQKMLDPVFLREFNKSLFGPSGLERRRHFDPATIEGDRRLMIEFGVREIAWPSWLPEPGHYDTLAPFPVPIVHWGHRTGQKPDGTSATRNPLHFFEMSWHPQYILACASCGWPQGPRGASEIINSKVPDLVSQLAGMKGVASKPMPRGELKVGVRIPLVIEHEVWGGIIGMFGPWDRGAQHGFSEASRLGSLLDQAMGLRRSSEYPGERERIEVDMRTELWDVAKVLERLQCRRCTAVGHVRYLPRYVLPIETHLAAKVQAATAKTLADRLDAAKARAAADPVISSVLWLPSRAPRRRPLDIAKRIAYAYLSCREEERELVDWGFATWLHEQALERKGSWNALLDRCDFPKTMSQEVREGALDELQKLQGQLRSVVEGRRPGQVVEAVLKLLSSSPNRRARKLLRRHYESTVIPKALEDHRRHHA